MSKYKDLIVVVLIIILGILIYNKEPDKIYVEPAVTEVLEKDNIKEIETVREIKTELKIIENSKEYNDLRKKLDSLMIVNKSDSNNVCFSVVKTQDTIISKQKDIISFQDNMVYRDSIIKIQLKQTIENKTEENNNLIKDNKKNLWKGRLQGASVGFVVGFITSKKI